MHSGKPKARAMAEGQVRLEVARWGLDGPTELRDPGEVLLRLVTQSAARVELYSRLLGEAYEAAERLREAHQASTLVATPRDHSVEDGQSVETPALQAARSDLERVFAVGGVGALIGVKRDADRFGRIYETEEAIRGLAQLEAAERDRCVSFATKAIAAGLAERQVRLAERQGALLAGAVRGILDDLGLSPEQQALVPAVVARHLRAVAAIEGEVVDSGRAHGRGRSS
jgi:hypothetical protein